MQFGRNQPDNVIKSVSKSDPTFIPYSFKFVRDFFLNTSFIYDNLMSEFSM